MRRMWMVVFTFVPTLAAGQDFTGFEIPAHRWHSVTASLSGSGTTSEIQASGRSEEGEQWFGTAALGGIWAFDSDDLRYSYGIRGRADGRWDDRASLLEPPEYFFDARRSEETDSRVLSELLSVEASVLQYPGSGPVGWSMTGVAFGTFAQFDVGGNSEFVINDTLGALRSTQDTHTDNSNEAYNLQAVLRVGVGRVRDATGIYRAWLLEERLERDGVLARPISNEARRKLAEVFYVEPNYAAPHDIPDKFFWQDVERILIEDGAVAASGLDAHSLLHAVDPSYSRTMRRIGFFVGPTVTGLYTYVASDMDRRDKFIATMNDSVVSESEATYFRHLEDTDRRAIVGAMLEYYRPLSLRWQFDFVTSGGYESEWISWFTEARLTWIVAERWLANGFVRHNVETPLPDENETRNQEWHVDYGGNLEYFLEDRTSLFASVTGGQDGFHAPSGSSFPEFQRMARFNLGITYHLSGELDAPGLVGPVRPIANPGPGY